MNRNKQQPQQNSNRINSLDLLDKTLPLTAATPPQLRNRRKFQFNGMNFETNPLSLKRSRCGLDGDAGDGRFPAPEDRRDSSSLHGYKASSSRLYRPRSCQSELSAGIQMNSARLTPPLAANPIHVLHQPEERSMWPTDNDSGSLQAGGEDVYSNSYNCNYSNNSAIKSASNNSLNNNNNNNNNNNTINNNKNNCASSNAERFQKVLAKYGKQAVSDEYNINNNINNNISNMNNNSISNSNNNIATSNKCNYSHGLHSNSNLNRSYNNRLTSNSYSSNIDRKSNIIQDEPNSEHSSREQPVFPSRPYNRSLKLSGFRYGQVRAGGGSSPAVANNSKMDYITLAGFLLGYLTSNLLFFLCWYFTWLKNQVVKLRNHFLGQANLWEFFDFEDTTRYSMQTKLLLAPIILGCSILYCVVNVLHLLIKLVRADVPRTVIDLVQRVARSHWP